ncbi:MAG: MBL fold metallo-hydrolase, partial [Betaproteobacteria bacterium]|nr:MBL fold metallo-hydrolase [Betaproteobacteria bacterium]
LLREIRQRTSLPIRRVIVSHYHADHFYGLQAFKQAGAEIWAHRRVQGYLAGDGPRTRLAERQQSLAPWVPRDMPLLAPDRYLDRDESFTLGGLQFQVRHIGPAHTAEDLMLLVKQDGVAFVGDLIFTGRVPFVGDADSRAWLAAIDRLLVDRPTVLVPGHGPASRDPQADLVLTRDYLLQLRKVMGDAVRDFVPVDEAVKGADWSRFSALPAFEAAHRINAYGTYLQMEREALAAPK